MIQCPQTGELVCPSLVYILQIASLGSISQLVCLHQLAV